jgi:hypothetical protein
MEHANVQLPWALWTLLPHRSPRVSQSQIFGSIYRSKMLFILIFIRTHNKHFSLSLSSKEVRYA